MRKPTAVAVVIAAISTGALALAMGPLNPPAGPVSETSPSLADLQADLEEITINLAGSAETAGPYESFRTPAIGDFQSNLAGSLIAEGRIYVHSITHTYGIVTVFDGPGSIDNSGRALSGNWIARSVHNYSVGGPSISVQYTTVTTPVEEIIENGLHAAWFERSPDGFIRILYKRLPNLATQGAAE